MIPGLWTDDRRRGLRWLVLAAALAVVATACVGAFLQRSSGPAGSPVAGPVAGASGSSGASPSTGASSTRHHRRGSAGDPSPSGSGTIPPASPTSPPTALPREVPDRLTIPAIGVSRHLLTLGLNPDHTVEVPAPSQAAYPGWYRLGPTPGQVGSAVILGHVDSMQGPAVFYELRTLDPGNRVDVRLRGGEVAHFEVQRVATYPNDEFPARTVYGPHGYQGLNLVTCGGDYDKARGGYQSNVVVYTRLVGSTPADLS